MISVTLVQCSTELRYQAKWQLDYGLWSKIFLKSGVTVSVLGIFHFCPRLAQTGIKGDLNGLSKVGSTNIGNRHQWSNFFFLLCHDKPKVRIIPIKATGKPFPLELFIIP